MKIRQSQWNSLKELCDDYVDCLFKIEKFVQNYSEKDIPVEMLEFVQSGFKAYVNSFYELTKNYLAFCNMEFNISIKSKDFIEYVTQCEESGLLPQDGALFCNALRMLRNEHAHGYERPTFEDV
ncbi:hypothetical protein, partial [Romboutsia sp.]|uniref:hypothetical protein n=1 Tax=Romboutsia sp. TaxID=1965302 RepID=UPI003F38062B